MKQIKVITLQEFKANDYRLSVNCHRCGRFAWLDLDELINQLGEDYPVGGNQGFRHKLKCSMCGSRDVQLTVHPG